MKKFFLRWLLALVLLTTSFLLPRISRAGGNDNPTGPTGEYNGSITTAGSYDPYTGNAKRFVEDLSVTGGVGAYPLKLTRILNTRQSSTAGFGAGGAWTHNYRWGLWVRPYREYDYEDAEYEGPDGQVTFPDGRTMQLDANPDGTYSPENITEPPGRLVNMPGGNYDLILPDGGRVKFEHPPGVSGNYGCVATRIIDPHGQTTTIARDSAGRISRITEPGGRFLQINYTTFSYPSPVVPGGIAHADVISSVQAFASEGNLTETVNYSYTYETVDYGFRSYNLTRVNYDDNTQATYTYYPNSGPYGLSGGRMNTCRDVRYAGAMSNIKYEYADRTSTHQLAVGQVKREKNLTTGQVVSEVTYPPTHPESNDPSRYVRTETRGDGATRSFQYSNDGHAELGSYTDFKNQRSYLGYGSASGGYLRVFIDARGHRTSVHKNWGTGAVLGVIHHDNTSIRYTHSDPNNPYYVTSKTDELGYVTFYDRDTANRIWRTRYPDGTPEQPSEEQFTYNGFGQVLTHRLTSGGTETFTYDGRGLKRTSYPPPTESDPDPWNHPTHYEYHQWGPHTDRLLRTVDPYGNSTWFYYNLRGQVTKVMHQDATYTQSGYNPDGTLAWTADENHPNASWNVGERTRYTYDEYKRVLTVTNPMNETTTNSYAIDINWAQPLLHTTNSLKYTNSPMGKNVVFDYDANFRKTSQVSALGTPDEAWTLFEYDAVGNLTKTTDPRFNVTTFGYDSRNRQVWVTDALNHTTTTVYDETNNKRSVTRHGNSPLQFTEYDPMNRLKKQIDEKGVPTRMEYDPAGNLARKWDGNNSLYQYEYDTLNRRTAMIYPDNSRESTTYDEVGNKKTYTNRAGATQTYAPADNRNRPTSFTWSDGTLGQSFEYDAKSRVRRTYNTEADISFVYDDADRKTSETEMVYSFGLNRSATVAYQYDPDGNRKRTIYPAGYQFIYAYTHRSQLANIKLDPAIYGSGYESPAVAYTYDRSGNRSLRTLLKGASTSNAVPSASTHYALDIVNRLYSQSTYFTNNRVGRFDYGYDALNRRTYEQLDSGLADGFKYDATDQVTDYQQKGTLNVAAGTVSSPVNGALVYDGAGNRTQVTGSWETNTYVRNALNQYINDAGGAAGYDGNGNLKSYGGWTVTYDAVNRPTELIHPGSGQQISYRYDVLNRRIAQKVNGVVTSHVYDNWNLIEERPTDGRQPHCYLFGGATNELVVSFGSGYPNYWYFQDGRGNTSHLTDNEHIVIERYTYDLGGRVSYFDGNDYSIASSSVDNRFLFTGAILLPETQLYDMRHRIYYPRWGRFLQTDPIGFKGDASNLYRYCGNNAVNRIDPLGLEPTPIPPELRAAMLEGMAQTLEISQSNSDGQGRGLERGKYIYNRNGTLEPGRNTSRGKKVDDNRQNVPPPAKESGRIAAYVHAHTHDSVYRPRNIMMRASSSRTSDEDKNFADAINKPIGTITPGWWPGTVGTREIYSPSLSAQERAEHVGGATYRQKKNGEWETLKEGPRSLSSPSTPAEGPSAKDIDMAHQATGVPSVGQEAVNFAPGRP